MTWEEICEDKLLATLPYRIESDRYGNIVMSPPPRSRHSEYQSEIVGILREKLKNGRALAECPIQTEEGVKAADVAWVSHARRSSRNNDPVYLIAPEICVEVLSPSNTREELEQRKRLFFEKGAVEFWLCGLTGEITCFDAGGQLHTSAICPDFPKAIQID